MKMINGDKVYVQLKDILFMASYYDKDIFLYIYFNSLILGYKNDDFINVSKLAVKEDIVNCNFILNYFDFWKKDVSELKKFLSYLKELSFEGRECVALKNRIDDLERIINFDNTDLVMLELDFDVTFDVFKLIKKDNV